MKSTDVSHHCAIQDKDEAFYLQFQIVICGLDSVEARRWINATLVNMVDWDDPEHTLKPLIDGGTEGAFISIVLLMARFPWSGKGYYTYANFLL